MDKGKGILLPGESSDSQNDAPCTNYEAVSSMAGPSSLHPYIESSDTTDPNSYNSETDSSYEESSSGDDEPLEKAVRSRLAFYQEMVNKSSEQQIEQSDAGNRKRKAKDPCAGMSLEMELHYRNNIIKRNFEKGMEEANMQGYLYGIVLEDDKVLSDTSESLQKWWYEAVKFQQSGRDAANQFYAEDQPNLNPTRDDEPQKRAYDYLMQLSDATLSSVLSAIMRICKPSQRKFPFQNKVQPPWWPTGDESWWEQTGIEKEQGQPCYKKPHDLKKKWKAVVTLAVIKNLAPDFRKLVKKVRTSKQVQNKLSAREMYSWNSALKEEMKIYSREHPHVPLSNLLRQLQPQSFPVLPGESSSSGADHEQRPRQQQLQTPQQHQLQQQPVIPMPNMQGDQGMFHGPFQNRIERFTCKNPGCLHHCPEFGFRTALVRDCHQLNCRYGSMGSSYEAPVRSMTSMMSPSYNVSQVITAPLPVQHQQPQMVQPSFPSMFPPQSTPLPQMFGSTSQMNSPEYPWQYYNVPYNGPAMLKNGLNMGEQQPPFNYGEFYNTEGNNSSNNGTYMQLLNEMRPNLLTSPQQQHHASSLMNQNLMENSLPGEGGSSTGAFQQSDFQPFELTEMQLFPNDSAAQTTFVGTQPNVAMPQWTQQGWIDPSGVPFGPSEPSLAEPSFIIPQNSDTQHIHPHGVQNPPPPVEQNQFSTGDSEFWPDPSFFP